MKIWTFPQNSCSRRKSHHQDCSSHETLCCCASTSIFNLRTMYEYVTYLDSLGGPLLSLFSKMSVCKGAQNDNVFQQWLSETFWVHSKPVQSDLTCAPILANKSSLHHNIVLSCDSNRQCLFPFILGRHLATVRRRKLTWFGHVIRHNSLSKTILQVALEDGRCRGRQRKSRMDNIKEWTSLPVSGLFTRAFCRKDWKRISAPHSPPPPPTDHPNGQETELNWTDFGRQTLSCPHFSCQYWHTSFYTYKTIQLEFSAQLTLPHTDSTSVQNKLKTFLFPD